jgi:hypothetical protein
MRPAGPSQPFTVVRDSSITETLPPKNSTDPRSVDRRRVERLGEKWNLQRLLLFRLAITPVP